MAFDMHGNRGVNDPIDQRDEWKRDVNLWVIAAGALTGALAGYVLTTPHGRRVLDETIALVDDFATSCVRVSQACARAQLAAADSWHAVTDVITAKSLRSR
jgi:hypothetical protein